MQPDNVLRRNLIDNCNYVVSWNNTPILHSMGLLALCARMHCNPSLPS